MFGLGGPKVQHQPPRCPNPGCRSCDMVGVWAVLRVDPRRPWKQIQVGSRGTCNDCGIEYSVTIDGVKAHGLPRQGVDQVRPPPSMNTDQALGSMVGDEAMPSFRGM